MTSQTLRIAASSANLGPGFDCLALALDLFNVIHIESKERGEEIIFHGEGEDELPLDSSNLLIRALEMVFEDLGRRPSGFHLSVTNNIPLRSGLGSSATAVLGGILAGCSLVNADLGTSEILRLASRLEPHADNTAASLLGGFVAVAIEADEVISRSIPIPDLTVAVVLPEINLSSQSMRQVLPPMIPHTDAAFTLGRAILTLEALRSGDFEQLRWSMKDRLHQPYRQDFIPGYERVQSAAIDAGAAAVTLSGAGPSMIAFAPEKHEQIARAMQETFHAVGVGSRRFILHATDEGAELSN
jgi:homoserine kinase